VKITSGDKAVLFLAAGLLVLAAINFKHGQNTLGVCWTVGVFGCGVMLYASHGGGQNHN
jgi:hypothetical protein